MKNNFITKFSFTFLLSIFVYSCGGKVETPTVTSWKVYHDRFFGTEIKYPENWMFSTDSKKIKLYSTQEVSEKFYELYSVGSVSGKPAGIEIELGSQKFSEAKFSTVDEFKKNEESSWQGITFSDSKNVNLDKNNAIEFSFEAQAGADAKLKVKQIVCAKDSNFYFVKYSGFNEYFDAYTQIFDSILASVILPRPKVKGKSIDESLPSEYFTEYESEYFKISHPDNFQYTFPAKKGETIFSVELMGYRQDCTILVDVLPVKNLNLEKVFDQNKGKFNATSSGDATVGGLPAKVLTYSPTAQIERRVYFIVKDDKVYRVFLTWFKPMAKDFKPAFEKALQSLAIK